MLPAGNAVLPPPPVIRSSPGSRHQLGAGAVRGTGAPGARSSGVCGSAGAGSCGQR